VLAADALLLPAFVTMAGLLVEAATGLLVDLAFLASLLCFL
jgi:hypothetical protein